MTAGVAGGRSRLALLTLTRRSSVPGPTARPLPAGHGMAGPRPSDGPGSCASWASTPRPNRWTTSVNKTQFQLHTLLTEQRHPKTWNPRASGSRRTPQAGLRMLFAVDEDVAGQARAMAAERRPLDRARRRAIEAAVLAKRKSMSTAAAPRGGWPSRWRASFWRPFWRKVKPRPKIWSKLAGGLVAGDRGRARRRDDRRRPGPDQLPRGFRGPPAHRPPAAPDRGMPAGDVVICVTEGGETSRSSARSWGPRAVDGAARLRPARKPEEPLLYLQQPRRQAPALRAQPEGHRGSRASPRST